MMTRKYEGRVFDPCMGWGGRLLGTVAQGWHYTGCDPNKETFANLQRMISFLGIDNSISIHNIGAEEFDFSAIDPVDVVVTSPPYFNLEIYTTDKEQSYNKHDTYISWRDGWYVPLIEQSLSILKDDGISAWNVMNFKKNDLVGDLISTHKKHGWNIVGTVGFDSPLSNMRKLKNKDVTYIFKRL
jgi:tRNA G10  N-methylase Trm11